MIDKCLQKVLTLFYFFVKKYKNIAWAPCGVLCCPRLHNPTSRETRDVEVPEVE
jgi:hypothetical protein